MKANRPWQNEELLNELYVEKQLSTYEIGEKLGCSHQTVNNWLRKHGIELRPKSFAPRKKPHHDRDTLVELYHDQGLNIHEIAEQLGVAGSTIDYWMKKLDIPTRSHRESKLLTYRSRPVPFFLNSKGYEQWHHWYDYERDRVTVHRLLAVAEYGFDAVKDMAVHHRNEIKWDNRPENIELLSHSEHNRLHMTKMRQEHLE